jgi:hypothetical protein
MHEPPVARSPIAHLSSQFVAMSAMRRPDQPADDRGVKPLEVSVRPLAAVAPPVLPLGSERRVADPSPNTTAGEEPVEVHVHIGRIEVTAQQPPALVARPRPKPTQPTASLSDYLARRKPS